MMAEDPPAISATHAPGTHAALHVRAELRAWIHFLIYAHVRTLLQSLINSHWDSAEWWNFDDACAYAGPHWVLPGGYGSLLSEIQRDVPVLLGVPVTRISHSRECDRGAVVDGGGEGRGGPVTVEFVDGGALRSLECDAVIVSVPLGRWVVVVAWRGVNGGDVCCM